MHSTKRYPYLILCKPYQQLRELEHFIDEVTEAERLTSQVHNFIIIFTLYCNHMPLYAARETHWDSILFLFEISAPNVAGHM